MIKTFLAFIATREIEMDWVYFLLTNLFSVLIRRSTLFDSLFNTYKAFRTFKTQE